MLKVHLLAVDPVYGRHTVHNDLFIYFVCIRITIVFTYTGTCMADELAIWLIYVLLFNKEKCVIVRYVISFGVVTAYNAVTLCLIFTYT